VNCIDDGLAGADGITIDLNGHTIDGRTIPTGSGIAIGILVGNRASSTPGSASTLTAT